MATLNSGKVIGADGQFISVEDTERYLGVPDENGKVLASNTDGARFWTVGGAQGAQGSQGAKVLKVIQDHKESKVLKEFRVQ